MHLFRPCRGGTSGRSSDGTDPVATPLATLFRRLWLPLAPRPLRCRGQLDLPGIRTRPAGPGQHPRRHQTHRRPLALRAQRTPGHFAQRPPAGGRAVCRARRRLRVPGRGGGIVQRGRDVAPGPGAAGVPAGQVRHVPGPTDPGDRRPPGGPCFPSARMERQPGPPGPVGHLQLRGALHFLRQQTGGRDHLQSLHLAQLRGRRAPSAHAQCVVQVAGHPRPGGDRGKN